MNEQKKRTFTHVIRERWCKGCNVCVSFCPKHVLELKSGKVVAARPEDCIGCRLCELRCPDYAIEVHETGLDKPVGKDASSVDYSMPPEADHA
jgi:2-oxoglutarate ferredoxin oxidoreductase subunit delta